MTEEQMPKYETAFIVAKQSDGSWVCVTNLEDPFMIDRVVTHPEVRQAAGELARYLHLEDLTTALSRALSQNSLQDSQRVTASVRDALGKRKKP